MDINTNYTAIITSDLENGCDYILAETLPQPQYISIDDTQPICVQVSNSINNADVELTLVSTSILRLFHNGVLLLTVNATDNGIIQLFQMRNHTNGIYIITPTQTAHYSVDVCDKLKCRPPPKLMINKISNTDFVNALLKCLTGSKRKIRKDNAKC